MEKTLKVNQVLTEKENEKKITVIKEINKLMIPNTIFLIFTFLQQTIVILFISGKYNNLKMINAMGVSHLYVNTVCFIMAIGLLSGVDILASAAISAKQYYLAGVYFHRGKLIAFLYLTVVSILNYMYCIRIIRFFGVADDVLSLCEHYIYKNILLIYLEIPFSANHRLLTMLNKAHITTYSCFSTVILHIFWCYLFITVFDMEIAGAVYSLILTQLINVIITSVYIHFYNPIPEINISINFDCFKGWLEYLKVALPSTFIILGTWLGYEIQAVIALFSGEINYAAHIIIVNLDSIIFCFTLSYRFTISIQMAKKIVSESVEDCKYFIKIAFCYSIFCIVIISTTVYNLRFGIAKLISPTEDVLNKTLEIFPILCVHMILLDAYQFFVEIFRGCSYIALPSIITFINNYIVQIAVSYFLTVTCNLGVKGVWIAYLISETFLFFIFCKIYFLFDLENSKKVTIERIENEKLTLKSLIDMETKRTALL